MNVLVIAVWVLVMLGVQPEEGGARAELPDVPRLVERLEQLDPSRPEEYFLLGEEVAGEAETREHFALARRLYVLAYELDRARGATELGARACVGLADVERLERDQRWLLALAGSIDARYARPDWSQAAAGGGADETALALSEAVGLARSGEGVLARERLGRPGVGLMLQRFETAMGVAGETGGAERVRRAAEAWPCPECRNRRIVIKRGSNPPEYTLCYTCGGEPGPKPVRAELVGQLRFESRLLSGIQRSWAAQVLADFGAPLRDPNPAEVAVSLGVDAARSVYRGGQWVEPSGR